MSAMFGRIQYCEALCGCHDKALKFKAMGCSGYIALLTAYMNGFKLWECYSGQDLAVSKPCPCHFVQFLDAFVIATDKAPTHSPVLKG